MAFNDLPANRLTSLLDGSSSVFSLKSGQTHVTALPGSNQCLSKQDAFIKYNLQVTSNTNGVAANQLLQKSFWEHAIPMTPGNPSYSLVPTYTADDDAVAFTIASDNAENVSYDLVVTKDGVVIQSEILNINNTAEVYINGTQATRTYSFNYYGRTHGNGMYGFKVRARNTAGYVSPFTPEIFYSFNSQTQGGHPTSLSATSVLDTSFTLNWVASTIVSTYKIYKDTVLFATVGQVTSHNITGLTSNVSSIWTIQAESVANPGFFSQISDALVVGTQGASVDATPPTAPTITSVDRGGATHTINWTGSTDNVGVESYELWRQDDNQPSLFFAFITLPSPYIDDSVVPGSNINYAYKIRAKDAAGNYSAFSNIISKIMI